MNAFALVWVLVTVSGSGHSGYQINYSPAMPDLQTCEFLQKQVTNLTGGHAASQCVQIKMVKD